MSRKAGIAHYLDDVTVSQTVGKPARIAGPIRAQGNHIVDRLGRTVTLRGVSILGMEAPGRHDLPTWEQEVSVAREWGANMIRLPLSDQRLLAGSCSYDPSYLSTLDALVSSITDKGMVAVLDLHGLAFKPCGRPLLAPMPDRRAVDFWRIIASHYATNGLVVFELYNEPNSVTPAQWLHGGKVVFQGISYSFVGMQSLYDAVRATGATNLVLFNGLNWASALPGAARVTGATNWAWGVHVYNCPNGVPPKALCIPGPGGIYDPTRVVDRFAVVADSQPLLVTEFGWPNASDGRFNHNVIQLVESRGWSGWIAWALDGTNQGMFDLVRNLGPVENPTVSGMPIIDGMTRD
jgi:aryl-phospho-beta-D-glucosidase BglC (GH1 family)